MLALASTVADAAAPPADTGDPGAPAGNGHVTVAREAAVRVARAGDHDAALTRLRALLAEHSDDVRVRHDLAVVSAWAGKPDHTLELLDGSDPDTLPGYVLDAYARAARDHRRWQLARSLYATWSSRADAPSDARIGLALTLADIGDHEAAAAALARARQDDGPSTPLLLACGYLHTRAGAATRALDCYQRAAATDPHDLEARRGVIESAAALGAAHRALALAEATPGAIDPAAMRRLEQDAAAHLIRWADVPGAVVRGGPAEAALSRLDQIAQSHGDSTTLAHDRIAALAAAGRSAEALAAFEALHRADEGFDRLPDYVLRGAAAAALDARRPELAATLYEAALARAPTAFELQTGLFIAYADLGRHDDARAVSAAMLADEPPWLDDPAGEPRANPNHTEARVLAALELAYRERYAASVDALDGLLAAAPGHSGARLSRADVLRWRGWPTRAGRDVDRVRHVDPGNVRARALAGQLAVDQRRYGEASDLLESLLGDAPDAAATAALDQRLAVHQRPELTVTADAGRSDGGAFSSRDWRIDAHYFGAPFHEHFRAFVHDTATYGRFDEGVGRDHRLGVGIDYRAPHWTARAEVNQGLDNNRKPGLALGAAWLPDDHWRLDLQAAENGSGVPLRATRIGVRGRELGIGVTHRRDETRTLRGGAGVLDLDDGNLRRSVWSELEQRLLTAPRHRVTGTLRAYAGDNSAQGRIYYNPASDRELAAGARHEWHVYRRYDRALLQRLEAEVGRYHQESFGTGTVWTITLAHDWRLGPRTRLGYGVRGGGRVYDGEREHMASAFLSLEHRL